MAEVIVVGMAFRCAAEELEEAVGVEAETAELADDFRLAGGKDGFKLAGVVHAEFVAAICRKQKDALAQRQGGGDIQNAWMKTKIVDAGGQSNQIIGRKVVRTAVCGFEDGDVVVGGDDGVHEFFRVAMMV